MRQILKMLKTFLSKTLNYETGGLSHLTKMFDRGIISLSLDDYKKSTPYQQLAWAVITNEIIKFRAGQKPFAVY